MKNIDWSSISSTELTLDYVTVQQQPITSDPANNSTERNNPVTNSTKILEIKSTQTTKATSTTITTTTSTTTTTTRTPKIAIAPFASNGNAFKITNRTVTSTTKKLQTVTSKYANLPLKPTTPKTTLAKSTPTAQTTKMTTTTKKMQSTTRKIAALSVDSKVANSSIHNSTRIVSYSFEKPMLIIPILAFIIAISGILVAFLLLWRYSKQNKWKRCPSSIEYRTRNYTNKCDDSDAFLLEDSMSITLTENGGDDNGDGGDDNCCEGEAGKKQPIICEKPKGKVKPIAKIKSKSDKKMNANNNKGTLIIPRVVGKSSIKSSKRIDEFSEKRCLTIDEEQFDFSLQTDDM